jgi:short-subunit dehydrogenase
VNPGFVESPGFPQRHRLGPIGRRLVVDPPFVAERILDAVENGRRELYVPRWYRLAALAQAFTPGALASSLARRGYRSSPK